MKYGWGMTGWIPAECMDGIHGSMYGGRMYGHRDGRMMNGLGMMRNGRLDGTSMAGAKIFKGACKWYDIRRGFGFIIPDNKSILGDMFVGDVFVHHTAIRARGLRSLNAGERVEFTVIQKNYCWHATCVTGTNGAYVEGPSESVRTKGHAEHKAAKANEIESDKSLLGTSGSMAEMADTSSVTRKADASADGPSQPQQTQQHKAVQSGPPPQLPGEETLDHNPLQMRGPNAKIFKGTCKWYNSQRGFGFIIPSNTQSMFGDVFVHHTVIHAEGFRSLNEGEQVDFTVILNEERKWHATSVTGPNGAYVEGLSTRKNTHRAHTESTSEATTQTTQTGAKGLGGVGKNGAEAHHDSSKSSSMSKLKSSPAHTSSDSSPSRRGLGNPQSGLGNPQSGEPKHGAAADSPTLHRHGRTLVNPQSAEDNVGFNSFPFKRDPDAKIYNGSCKWYNAQRGFGFVIADNLIPDLGDVFVHHTVILSKGFRSLNAGERLEFTVIQKDGKWHATSVSGPDRQPVQGYPQNRSHYTHMLA